jgi:hypothetical protein
VKARAPWGLWTVLTILVWGLFAPDRGLYQDDVSVLSIVQEAWNSGGLPALFQPMGTPTRRLLGIPFFLAWATGDSALALQLLYGAVWLAIGWAAFALSRELFPESPRAGWLAGTLTVCATSDFLTDSPVALGYQVCVLLGVLALVWMLRFLRGGGWLFLLAGCAGAAASVFTIDGAVVALAMAPLLFVAVAGLTARTLAACAAWGAALLPYGIAFLVGLREASGYLTRAMAPLPFTARLHNTGVLAANDVAPWMWVLARRSLGVRPPHVIPPWLWAVAGLAGVAIVWRFLAQFAVARGLAFPSRERLAAAWCLAAALLSHAAYAGVAFSELFYRTHVLSRVFVSIVLGLAAARLLARGGSSRIGGLALVALFTGFGVAGGMERQDLYLATWRRHRVEVSSILEEVPAADPRTTLLLVVPPDPSYQATEVPYLAARWSTLLYPSYSLRPRVFLWSMDAGTSCLTLRDGFRCRAPEEKECFESGTCPGTKLRWDEIVLLTWHAEEGRFRLEEEIPNGLLGDVPPPLGLYRPRDLVHARPPEPRAARLLRGDVALARLLP